jgi:hypothetical protein
VAELPLCVFWQLACRRDKDRLQAGRHLVIYDCWAGSNIVRAILYYIEIPVFPATLAVGYNAAEVLELP